MEAVTLLVFSLACCSALVYAAAAGAALRGRWAPRAGRPAANAAALAAFAIQRVLPHSTAIAAVAGAAALLALWLVARRSDPPVAAILACIPIATMLVVELQTFFPAQDAAALQNATIALLCAAAPAAVTSLALGRSAFRTNDVR